jgi:hypothetical protein
MRYEELLECRHCGVVGSPASQLCQPVLLLDSCLDHSMRRDHSDSSQCEQMLDRELYACAVCARPAIEALDVCYPRRRSSTLPVGEGGRRAAPPAR